MKELLGINDVLPGVLEQDSPLPLLSVDKYKSVHSNPIICACGSDRGFDISLHLALQTFYPEIIFTRGEKAHKLAFVSSFLSTGVRYI